RRAARWTHHADAAGPWDERGPWYYGRDRTQRPCAGRRLAPFRDRQWLSLYRRLFGGVGPLCLRSAGARGRHRADRLLLWRLPKTISGMLERAYNLSRQTAAAVA